MPFEALFRSLQKLLIESAITEFQFTSRFFGDIHGDIFMRVFARSISQVGRSLLERGYHLDDTLNQSWCWLQVLESLEGYLCQCYDPIAVMLLIHITHLQRRSMNLRRMACLVRTSCRCLHLAPWLLVIAFHWLSLRVVVGQDSYFDRVNMMLWPRFKQILELNLQSIRVANLKKLGSVDIGPHYISRRYGEFTASIANLHRTLQADDMSDDSVLHNLYVRVLSRGGVPCTEVLTSVCCACVAGLDFVSAMLRSEMIRLLQKLAEVHSTKKDRMAFMINNVNAIINVLREVGSDHCLRFLWGSQCHRRVNRWSHNSVCLSEIRLPLLCCTVFVLCCDAAGISRACTLPAPRCCRGRERLRGHFESSDCWIRGGGIGRVLPVACSVCSTN